MRLALVRDRRVRAGFVPGRTSAAAAEALFAYFEHSQLFLAMNDNNRINHPPVGRERWFFQAKQKTSVSCAAASMRNEVQARWSPAALRSVQPGIGSCVKSDE